MKIVREKLIGIWHLIDRLSNTKTNVKFHYLLMKNKKILEPEIKALQEAQAASPPERLEELNSKRIPLCEEFCVRDEENNPVIQNDNYVFEPDQKTKLEEKFKELEEEYADVLAEMEKIQNEFKELLDTEVEINLAKIPLSIFPDLNGKEVEIMFDIIDEDK